MINKIKKQLQKIEPDELYSIPDIVQMKVIISTSDGSSGRFLRRLIVKGVIKSFPIGTGSRPRHYVKGSELIKYLKATYKI